MAGAGECPTPITFEDDSSKKDRCVLTLGIAKLETKKSWGKKEVKNGTLSVQLKPDLIRVEACIDQGDGTNKSYLYERNPPQDIDTANSSYTIHNGEIVVKIRKKKPESWAMFEKNFTSRSLKPAST